MAPFFHRTADEYDGLHTYVMSNFFTINFGVRQGSVLSPYLFAVYVNDVDYSSTSCHVILYADDILLLASSILELEKLLHACENELSWLDMSINFKKILLFACWKTM